MKRNRSSRVSQRKKHTEQVQAIQAFSRLVNGESKINQRVKAFFAMRAALPPPRGSDFLNELVKIAKQCTTREGDFCNYTLLETFVDEYIP